MKRLMKYLSGVLPFFAAYGIQLVVVGGISLFYYILVSIKVGLEIGFDNGNLSKVIGESISQEILHLISVIGVLVCGIVFFFWYRREIRGEVRGSLPKVFTKKNVVLLMLLGLGCQFFLSGVMSLIQPFLQEIFNDYADTVEGVMSGSEAVVLLLMVLVAPIGEELIFRGVILHKKSRVFPFLGANFLQALLFGIYHWNIVQGVYATLIGFLLGLIYNKYKTIYAPIFVHMIINASSFLILFVPDNVLGYGIVVMIGGALIVLSLFIIKPFDMQVYYILKGETRRGE